MSKTEKQPQIFTEEELSKYYQYPVDIACLYLNITKRRLKENLASLGIAKWPYHYSVHGTLLKEGKNVNFYDPNTLTEKFKRKTTKTQKIEKQQKMNDELTTLTTNLQVEITENHLKQIITTQKEPKEMNQLTTVNEDIKLPSFQEFLEELDKRKINDE
eukprot:gene5250-8861_t